jgi:hypothetical protein
MIPATFAVLSPCRTAKYTLLSFFLVAIQFNWASLPSHSQTQVNLMGRHEKAASKHAPAQPAAPNPSQDHKWKVKASKKPVRNGHSAAKEQKKTLKVDLVPAASTTTPEKVSARPEVAKKIKKFKIPIRIDQISSNWKKLQVVSANPRVCVEAHVLTTHRKFSPQKTAKSSPKPQQVPSTYV